LQGIDLTLFVACCILGAQDATKNNTVNEINANFFTSETDLKGSLNSKGIRIIL